MVGLYRICTCWVIRWRYTHTHTHISSGSRGGGGRGVKPPLQRFFFFFLLVSTWKFPRTWTLNPPSKNSGPEPPLKEFLDPPLHMEVSHTPGLSYIYNTPRWFHVLWLINMLSICWEATYWKLVPGVVSLNTSQCIFTYVTMQSSVADTPLNHHSLTHSLQS